MTRCGTQTIPFPLSFFLCHMVQVQGGCNNRDRQTHDTVQQGSPPPSPPPPPWFAAAFKLFNGTTVAPPAPPAPPGLPALADPSKSPTSKGASTPRWWSPCPMASKAFVASLPAKFSICLRPPGCSLSHSVTLYTRPRTTTQQFPAFECRARSSADTMAHCSGVSSTQYPSAHAMAALTWPGPVSRLSQGSGPRLTFR